MTQELPLSLLANRLVRGYVVLGAGIIALALRRLILPSQFDVLPITVAIRTLVWNCYGEFELVSCGEPVIAGITFLALTIAIGWGGCLNAMIAVALMLPAVAVYYLLVPSWAALILLFIPLLAYVIIDIGLKRLLEEAG